MSFRIACHKCDKHETEMSEEFISLSSGETEAYFAGKDDFIPDRSWCDSAPPVRLLSRQGVGRIRHLSCRILWLQTLVKLRKEFSCDQNGRRIHSICHLVGF